MATIVTRASGATAKGSPLTNAELDANFINLNTDKSEKAANLSDLTNIAQAKINLGLGNVSNTADTNKPISTAQQTALDGKQAADADLAAIAGLAGTSGILKKTAANTWALDTASYLTGNQSIRVSGDASGNGTTEISLTLANSGVTAGTYNNAATTVTPITVDAKGRVTATGAAVTVTPAWDSVTNRPTTVSGYGITDAVNRTATTGAAYLPIGTTAQRPAGSGGMFRFNSDTQKFEGYYTTAAAWGDIGGATVEGYTAKAWVNFNGTGVVAIRASGNVSSITDLSVGKYYVNFATAFPDTNYTVVASSAIGSNGLKAVVGISGGSTEAADKATTRVQVAVGPSNTPTLADCIELQFAVFR